MSSTLQNVDTSAQAHRCVSFIVVERCKTQIEPTRTILPRIIHRLNHRGQVRYQSDEADYRASVPIRRDCQNLTPRRTSVRFRRHAIADSKSELYSTGVHHAFALSTRLRVVHRILQNQCRENVDGRC